METLTNRLKLLKAILEVQKSCPAIPRTKVAKVYSQKTGSSYEYRYAPYDSIMEIVQPLLTKNSLGLFHNSIQNEKGKVMVKTTLFHESGEFIETICDDSITENLGRMSRIQTIGNLKTFLKRYNVGDLLNLSVSDDTDGVGLGDTNKSKKQQNLPAKTQQPQVIQYTTKENKIDTKPNPNYICDENGVKRYNKVSHKFNDKYQEKNGLILSHQWVTIEKLLKEHEVSSKQFADWLEAVQGVKFYDIKNLEVDSILNIITNDTDLIFDIPKKDDKEGK